MDFTQQRWQNQIVTQWWWKSSATVYKVVLKAVESDVIEHRKRSAAFSCHCLCVEAFAWATALLPQYPSEILLFCHRVKMSILSPIVLVFLSMSFAWVCVQTERCGKALCASLTDVPYAQQRCLCNKGVSNGSVSPSACWASRRLTRVRLTSYCSEKNTWWKDCLRLRSEIDCFFFFLLLYYLVIFYFLISSWNWNKHRFCLTSQFYMLSLYIFLKLAARLFEKRIHTKQISSIHAMPFTQPLTPHPPT